MPPSKLHVRFFRSDKSFSFRIPIKYLLLNLAVADIFFVTFHISELVYNHIDTHPDGAAGIAACILRNGTLQFIGADSSTFTVVAIAVERYFAVIYPTGNKGKLTMKKYKMIIIGFWIAATILNIPGFLMLKYKKDTNFCAAPKQWIDMAFNIMWFTYTITSSTLMVGLYSRVVYTLWFKRQDDNVITREQQVVLRIRKRVTLMVFTVSAIFGVCWAPDIIMHGLEVIGSYKLSHYAIPFAHTMLIFNAAVNPFTYAFISRPFRTQMKEVLCGAPCSTSTRIRSPRNQHDIEMANLTSQPIA